MLKQLTLGVLVLFLSIPLIGHAEETKTISDYILDVSLPSTFTNEIIGEINTKVPLSNISVLYKNRDSNTFFNIGSDVHEHLQTSHPINNDATFMAPGDWIPIEISFMEGEEYVTLPVDSANNSILPAILKEGDIKPPKILKITNSKKIAYEGQPVTIEVQTAENANVQFVNLFTMDNRNIAFTKVSDHIWKTVVYREVSNVFITDIYGRNSNYYDPKLANTNWAYGYNEEYDFPSRLPYPKPSVNGTITTTSRKITGSSVPGGRVMVGIREEDSFRGISSIGTNGKGEYTLPIPLLKEGAEIWVIASTDAEMAPSMDERDPNPPPYIESDPLKLIVRNSEKDITPPTKPRVVSVSSRFKIVSGKAEPGSNIIVKDGNRVIGSGFVEPNGNFVIVITPQKLTSKLQLTSQDSNGNVSPVLSVKIK
ncbi:Ig-like domain-containing protein [Pseudoneobacillus rhizosphaerae]|uniref:Bacterial Ig domain-containing protein n=1 Tax=Pseudoneobacillus rhizosphaerae TaxID=2880968 RepID=A0A9C7GCX4_9BACI|nr:Ig-like domain-containing protein [Pseudoneobacillus rhizosphaerae]CAG9609998.1 hypothetical protein NEOCIP111885_03741 [Pseudoneobacillus rhizosphaerae]